MLSGNAVSTSIEHLLRGMKPAAYCDPCLAEVLNLPLDIVTEATEHLGKTAWAEHKIARCTPCRSTRRVVTRVLA